MPELAIPDDFKCIAQTELIQNMQNPQILLKFTQNNTYWERQLSYQLKRRKKKRHLDA